MTKQNFILSLIFITSNCNYFSMNSTRQNQHNDCPEILDSKILYSMIINSGRDIDDFNFQLENTCARVYLLNNSTVIMLSDYTVFEGGKGYYFSSPECFREISESESFPFFEHPRQDLFERNTTKMLSYFDSAVSNKLIYKSVDESEYKKVQKQLKSKKITDNELILFLFRFAQDLKKEFDGSSWIIEKQYGEYISYFVPGLESNGHKILLSEILNLLDSGTDLDFSKKLLRPRLKGLVKWKE